MTVLTWVFTVIDASSHVISALHLLQEDKHPTVQQAAAQVLRNGWADLQNLQSKEKIIKEHLPQETEEQEDHTGKERAARPQRVGLPKKSLGKM